MLERLHISRYESMTTEWGYNIERGGSAPGKMCDEQKEFCSKVFKEYYSDAGHRKKNSARMKAYWQQHYDYMYSTSQSDVVKKKRTESLKRAYKNPEVKEKLSKGLIERWANPEYKGKMSKRMIDNAWNNTAVCCEGKEYKSISEFSRTFGLCGSTVQTWLDGSRSMPQDWFDKGLCYKDKPNVARRRSFDGKYCLEIDGQYFTKICDLASYLGMQDSTLSRYINGKRKCPSYLLERGFKY